MTTDSVGTAARTAGAATSAGASTASSASGTTSSASQRFDEQYTTFLQLLTTQLQNQNPVEPMNTNEFTQQVVAYSGLEQQINTNSQLEQLVSLVDNFMSGNAINYVGDTVTFEAAETPLVDGSALWQYDVARPGVSGTIEIRNSAGQVVRTDTADATAGRHTFDWDGRMDDGNPAPDGNYSISIAVRDGNDVAIPVDTSVAARVDAVDLTGPAPLLVVGNRSIPVSDVLTVRPTN